MNKGLVKKACMCVVLAVFAVLAVYAVFSSFFVKEPLSGDILFIDSKVTKNEKDGQMEYVVMGKVDSIQKYFFGKSYTVTITEEHLGKVYDVEIKVPFWTKSIPDDGRCHKFKVIYRKFVTDDLFMFISISDEGFCYKEDGFLEFDDIISSSMEFINSLGSDSEGSYPISLVCDDNCVVESASVPPLQWWRYAQFSSDSLNAEVDIIKYLDDLFEYDLEDFDWRLFPYGEIINNSNTDEILKYKNKYLEILNGLYHPSYFVTGSLSEDIVVYTNDNPNEDELDKNWNGSNLHMNVSRMSANIMDLAAAYEMTDDHKYIEAINEYLSVSHLLVYYQDDLVSPEPVDLKPSTCNLLMADARAYQVTGDKNYLSYINYIVDRGDIAYLYGDVSIGETGVDTFTPMNFLPCMVAFEILIESDDENAELYTKDVELFYDYIVKNNLIDMDPESNTYGLLILTDYMYDEVFVAYDISSTEWFVNIMTRSINRGFGGVNINK